MESASVEIATQKRAELEQAIREEKIELPAGILVAALVSAGVAAASYAISYAFQPKQPRQEVGKLTGTLQLQNSEQGIFIPEIYGAGPTVNVVSGVTPTYQNVVNASVGSGGAITKNAGGSGVWNAFASTTANVTAGNDAFIRWNVAAAPVVIGFGTVSNPSNINHLMFGVLCNLTSLPSNTVKQAIQIWSQLSGSLISTNDVGSWTTSDTIQVEIRDNRFHAYKNSVELTNGGFAVPGYPLWPTVMMHNIGSGTSALTIKTDSAIGDAPNHGRGGCKVPAIIIWTSGIRKHVTSTPAPGQGGGKGGGGGGGGSTVTQITYDIDAACMFANRGPYSLIREYANADVLIDQYTGTANPSGVYDPGVGPDPGYDPGTPPDPIIDYEIPIFRVDAAVDYDAEDVGTGTIQGGASPFAFYPGNTDQQPDPDIESDVDAKHGAGSTPAYHNRSYIKHKTLSLSRWSGIFPNITGVLEHATLKTMDAILASLCERVNVKTANGDYSFTALSAIKPRGMLIAGRTFTPAEILGSPDIQLVYNYFVTEVEGQLKGYLEGTEPSLTIADTEVGWIAGDAELPDVIPEVETIQASEISLPRQVDVKYIDPDHEWEPNTQSAIRQITQGETKQLVDVQLTLLADEARAAAQRKLYRDYVGGAVYKFTLPWTYLYLHPGYKLTINRAEGFSHVMRLTSITGGVGILECEGIALEPAVFTQPATGVFPPGGPPSQQVPASTVLQLFDTPLLRDGDETINNGVIRYAGGVPRTGDNQTWTGFILYGKRRDEYEFFESFTVPATVGTIVSVSDLHPNPAVVDIPFTADASTDVCTSTAHELQNDDAVVPQNTGGGLPSPLVAGTTYYVRDRTTNTFKLAATLGGSAINLTTNGTGSHYLNVGKITVDLYGTAATLVSITKADLLAGENLAVAGNMVFNFMTATQVSGFPNRWDLTVLRTGQRGTDHLTSSVAATQRFAFVNEAIKAVPMLVEDVNDSIDYRAVTVGQSQGDAATITNVWTGNTLRARKVMGIVVNRDASADFMIQFIGDPRPSEVPEDYAVEIWKDTDRSNPANRKRILPITSGTSHAVLLRVSQGEPQIS